jgi:hypothetical protein
MRNSISGKTQLMMTLVQTILIIIKKKFLLPLPRLPGFPLQGVYPILVLRKKRMLANTNLFLNTQLTKMMRLR